MRQPKTTLDSIYSLLQLSGMDSPNRLAAGLCLGLLIGLLPKLSLLPWALAVLGILSTANLATLLTGFALGCIAIPAVDLLALPLGEKLMSIEAVTPLLAESFATPVLTHFHFHETATLGTLALGLLMLLPTFFVARACFNRIQPRLEGWLSTTSRQSWTDSPQQAHRSVPNR